MNTILTHDHDFIFSLSCYRNDNEKGFQFPQHEPSAHTIIKVDML